MYLFIYFFFFGGGAFSNDELIIKCQILFLSVQSDLPNSNIRSAKLIHLFVPLRFKMKVGADLADDIRRAGVFREMIGWENFLVSWSAHPLLPRQTCTPATTVDNHRMGPVAVN